ncbi:8 glycosyltransferase [Enterococcus sp. 10A9_DIV0425]|uniref:8 glycosyltransferase n=1 Tax=Candidatus Enterococcus wittei TaxID=1987383 RepID=A0A2C9XNX3_9ENTE|nr:glycosyltransferase family 8 protein [Enterococcus sp. 10A9_DIV0425]OTP11905.1 8 glycosyltransferase [Enterococcus sp. 10A9_DIV0425]THE15964.1 glycosyltransferase family 8 protein [Enterococcus hirae]
MEIKYGTVPVVTASDENYAPYLSVMIATALKNSNKMRHIYFYVIDDGLSEYSKEGLKQTVKEYSEHASIQFLTVEKDVYEDFLVSDHITTTAYLRISLPKILSKYNYQKVLYLDSDILVLDDIVNLYDEPLHGKTIGAVIDPGQTKALKRLGIDSDEYYFNSGVMVIDIDQWNKKNITEKTISFLKEHGDRIIYHDQDALNAILYGDWEQFHPKWNMQSSLIFEKHPAPDDNYKELYKSGNKAPSIVHFTGHDKPWNTLKDHPYTQIYLKNLAHSALTKVGEVNE